MGRERADGDRVCIEQDAILRPSVLRRTLFHGTE